MQFWMALMFEPLDQFHQLARWAEELGFEGLALADHVALPSGFGSVHPSGDNPFGPESLFPDPFTSIASMAAVTSRLRFMSYVYILAMREPFSVAKQVATAATLSDNRVVMGAGVGWLTEEISLLGHPVAGRGRRVDEMLDIIRDFWADGWAEHHGECYDFGPTAMFPVPSGPIPIWIGGKSGAALARAARMDGWVGMNYDLDEVHHLLDELDRALVSAGRDREGFEVLVIPNAAPDADLYRRLADRGVTSTVALPWPTGDPAFASLAAKRAAMERFAEEVIVAAGR